MLRQRVTGLAYGMPCVLGMTKRQADRLIAEQSPVALQSLRYGGVVRGVVVSQARTTIVVALADTQRIPGTTGSVGYQWYEGVFDKADLIFQPQREHGQ